MPEAETSHLAEYHIEPQPEQKSRPPAAQEAPKVKEEMNEKEFLGLLEINNSWLKKYCNYIAGNPSDGEDLFQETILRAWRFRNDFKKDNNFSAWLHRIINNAWVDMLRRNKDRLHDPLKNLHENDPRLKDTASTSAEGLVTAQEDNFLLHVSLQRLTPIYREIITLKDIKGLSHKEIAELLNITEQASKMRHFKAMIKLREKMEKLGKARPPKDSVISQSQGLPPDLNIREPVPPASGRKDVPSEGKEYAGLDKN